MKKKCVLPSRGVRGEKESRGREAVSTVRCLSPRSTSSSKCSPTVFPPSCWHWFSFFAPRLDDSRRPVAARQWDAELAAAPLRVSLQKVPRYHGPGNVFLSDNDFISAAGLQVRTSSFQELPGNHRLRFQVTTPPTEFSAVTLPGSTRVCPFAPHLNPKRSPQGCPSWMLLFQSAGGGAAQVCAQLEQTCTLVLGSAGRRAHQLHPPNSSATFPGIGLCSL